jgi:hypothetical protein
VGEAKVTDAPFRLSKPNGVARFGPLSVKRVCLLTALGSSSGACRNPAPFPSVERQRKTAEPPRWIKPQQPRVADEVLANDWHQHRNPVRAPKWLLAFDSPRVSSEGSTSYGP